MSEQYEGKTQLTGLVAGVSMIAVLLFCTGFIGYLPVPVLTAIVISALMGATEFHRQRDCGRSAGQNFSYLLVLFRSTYSGYDKRSFRNNFCFCRENSQTGNGPPAFPVWSRDTVISAISGRAQTSTRLTV